jgi:hypothetical protein
MCRHSAWHERDALQTNSASEVNYAGHPLEFEVTFRAHEKHARRAVPAERTQPRLQIGHSHRLPVQSHGIVGADSDHNVAGRLCPQVSR